MKLYYSGSMTIKGDNYFEFIKILNNANMLIRNGTGMCVSSDEIKVIYKEAGITAHCLGLAVSYLKAADAHVDGRIEYEGEEEGAFIITDNTIINYDKNELAIIDMSDRQLEDEAKRRGYRLVKESDYKPPAEFEPIKKTEYFEAV